MTAGVQSFEPATAYLPSQASPSAQTNATTKADGDKTGAGADVVVSDFQSEMDLQQAAPEPKSSGFPQTDSEKKTGSAKITGKKQNAPPGKVEEAVVLAAAMPVQVVEPQRPILPITFVPGQPDQNTDEATQRNTFQGQRSEDVQDKAFQQNITQDNISISLDKVSPEIPLQGTLSADETSPSKASRIEVIPVKTSRNDVPEASPAVPPQKPATILKPSPSSRVAVSRENAPGRRVTPESPDVEPNRQPAPAPLTSNQTAPSQPHKNETQPVSQPALKVPELSPLEPAPAAATQKIVDAAPSSPSALAFAARLAAVTPDKTDPAVPDNPLRPSPGADSPGPTRIPVRYGATAQIIQRTEQKSDADPHFRVEPTKFAEPALDRSARPDLVLASTAAPAHETAVSPQSPRTPEPGPSARIERVIEPPAAPPTSSRDIRVQVPNQNGGSTQVRFVESGGEVRVSVRTSDEGLAQNLRSHLNDLSQRLSEGGVQGEIWKPAADAASSQNNQHQQDREGRGSSGRESGSHSGGHAGTRGDQRDPQERPAWLEEMEASLEARNA